MLAVSKSNTHERRSGVTRPEKVTPILSRKHSDHKDAHKKARERARPVPKPAFSGQAAIIAQIIQSREGDPFVHQSMAHRLAAQIDYDRAIVRKEFRMPVGSYLNIAS